MARRRSSCTGKPQAGACGFRCGHGGGTGFSLTELLVVVALAATTTAVAVPMLTRMADTADVAGAARYLASTVAFARLDATRRQRTVAIRFLRTTPPSFQRVVDGDGDGVTSADITAGVDRPLGPPTRLEDHFPRASFGIHSTMQGIDGTVALAAGEDPIRLGAADQLSLSPLGSATSGTLYLASRAGTQFAIRIAGVTGRARVLRYDRGRGSWHPY